MNRLIISLHQKRRKVIDTYSGTCHDQLTAYHVLSLLYSVGISIKQEGKFLDLTDVPLRLKLRSNLRTYVYIRDCYEDIIADIVASLPRKKCKTIAILGTPGIGKSALFLVVLKLLLEDPTTFGLTTRSFYFQTRPEAIWLYHHEGGDSFALRVVEFGEQLNEAIPLFVDMESEFGSPTEHAGVSLIFSSYRASRYNHELTKNGWRKVLPIWSSEEQAVVFNSTHFSNSYGEQVAQRAHDNILYFGGSIHKNIDWAITATDPKKMVDNVIMRYGEYVCEHFFTGGVGGAEEAVLDFLVHRNPEKGEQGYNFDAVACAYSIASPYILRRLLALNSNFLVTAARNNAKVVTI